MSVIVSANLSNREDMENGIAVKRSEGTCCISLDFKDCIMHLDMYTQYIMY